MFSAKKALDGGKKELKKHTALLKKDGGTAECDRWLQDNAALLMSCITNGIKSVGKHRGDSVNGVFRALSDCIDRTENGNVRQSFSKAIQNFDIPLDLCAELAPLTFAAAALKAVRTYTNAPDSFGGAVKLIFGLRDIDFDGILPEVCEAEHLLTLDPSGDYVLCDRLTKENYRRAVCRSAKKKGLSAIDFLRRALGNAEKETGTKRHIGFHIDIQKPQLSHGAAFLCFEGLFAASVTATSVILCTRSVNGFFGSAWGRIILCVLAFLPAFAALRPLSDRLSAKLFPPCFLPSYEPELTDCLPPAVIAVSSVLPSADRIKKTGEHLLETKMSDSSPDTVLVFLCDLKNADVPSLPEDGANIRAAEEMINGLNEQYGGGFVFALRDRVFAPSENSYGGHERKRGALCTLVKLITEGKNGFSVLTGDTEKLKGARYLLALDSDTVLPFESLKKLVCTSYHPMNRPVFSPEKRRITEGYGIIAPRVETSAESSEKTFFSAFMTLGGISAYSSPVSERYMDMFGSSLFTGKGLIDIKAFSQTCADTFPEGIILSHDIPEGSLLNTAFAGRICLSDSFPSKPSAFYKRAHRWIRGDMQNLRLIHGTVNGSSAAPSLTGLTKYQLLDNLRRAVTPVSALAALLLSVFFANGTSLILFLWAMLSVISEPAVSFFGEIFRLGAKALTSVYLTASAGVGLKALIRAAYLAASLPENAAVSLSATVKGLYRGLISHKKTLEWTTAAQGEHGRQTVFMPCVVSLACAAALVFGSPLHRLWGILILFNIPFSFSDGIANVRSTGRLSAADRETLKSYAAAEWRYFEQYVTAEENWLPPDNVQLTPVKRTAHRTSPTDIGMYLMSCLTAADLSLITEEQLHERLKNTCETLKKMKRCCGLLFNWYDTCTLDVLRPHFVSTVDCGNYLCCLSALGEGLKKLSGGNGRFSDITDFIRAEISASDLGVLFSKRRGLFSVGLNGNDRTLSPSFYDTYMSEMRLTSYYAIALREVPVSHNEKLSRAAVASGLYTSAASWTGTAFEYLMPTLFLPVFDGTFLSEALYNCVREQKRAVRRSPMPWGISESGYYAFDRELNYRYKAHGLRRLSVKADADCENVFSPYSSFLALSVAPTDAVKNLSRFVSLGAFGSCGFYEALDFTAERVAPENYMAVRSFMAHHKGMSLIACGNALFNNINVRRFISCGQMKAAQSLLTEKLPTEVPFTAHMKKKRELFQKKIPTRSAPVQENAAPRCSMFTDGDSSLICTADGKNRFLFSSLSVFGSRHSATGIFAAVRTARSAAVPLSQNGRGTLKNSCFYNKVTCGGAVVEHALCLSRSTAGIYAPVKITDTSGEGGFYELLFFAEPELLPVNDFDVHKSYSDLFIKTEVNTDLCCVTFERRENGIPTAAAALGFADSGSFVFTCRRSRVLSPSVSSEFPFADGTPDFDGSTADVSPCFAASVQLRLAPGEKREKVLIAAVGDDRTDAVNKLSLLRGKPLPKTESSSPVATVFSGGTQKCAENFFLSRFFDGIPTTLQRGARLKNTASIAALWEKGISGDLGIVRVAADDAPPSLYGEFIAFHSVLSKAGCPFDLVFTLFSPDDYSSTAAEKLRNVIKKMHAEDFLGNRGGIHIVNICAGSVADILLTAVADAVFPNGEDEADGSTDTEFISQILPCERAVSGADGFIPNGYFINTRHTFPLSLTLSNGTMGTLLTDTSLGFTWFANARLCPLTPRPYDVSEPMYGEMLTLYQDGVRTDCIRGASVFFTSDSALYRSVINGMHCDVKVTVASRGAVKEIALKLTGIKNRCSVCYSVTPVMHEKIKFAKMCSSVITENGITTCNPFNADFRGFMNISCKNGSGTVLKNGRLNMTVNTGDGSDCFETVFRLVFSANEKGIKPLTDIAIQPFTEKKVRFKTGSDKLDIFANALLYHQTADSRVRSRTGYYQCSGAYGFRDQLQDAMCLVRFSPETTRRMLLLCAAAQFTAGDVLHWFHLIPSVGKKGVRTHCSDDMLWLPLAAAVYAEKTSDTDIFSVSVPYLAGDALSDGERRRYDLYRRSSSEGTVYEHCMKSIFKACEFGAHGLPLIKDGDWNDSFGEIGGKGKGESVWLAMFLKLVCDKMYPFARKFGKAEHAVLLQKISSQMTENVMRSAYNGRFFTRAFFDDGTPLGDGSGRACRIDLLPQAFASFAEIGTPLQRKNALLYAFNELADRQNKLIKLFAPPFTPRTRRAGYVNDYPEGVRENGGQYTHAAVWLALALLKEGLTHEAAEATGLLLPSLKDPCYEREPYAMCGDVYSMPGAKGKGGWSLYTGAAGWMLALADEWEKQNAEEKRLQM